MTDAATPPKPTLDWSGNAPFPFTRESSIRLDERGVFWHDGHVIEHPGLQRGMHAWLTRHPVDGRYVLENGYDWCYVTIDLAPIFVRFSRIEGERLCGTLSDGSDVAIDDATLTIDAEGALWCRVKPEARGGAMPARFDAHAMVAIGDAIVEREGAFVLTLGARTCVIASVSARGAG